MTDDTKDLLRSQLTRAERRAEAEEDNALRLESQSQDARASAIRARAAAADLRALLEQAP